MDQEFCKQIDEEDLIEKYIAGKLHGELLNRLTEHLSECQKHSEAVNLEKILSRGVRDFARTELKDKLNFQVQKNEISKYYILRYAAILFVAILAPIVLYYQFVKTTPVIETIAENPLPVTKIESAQDAPSVESEEVVPEPVTAPPALTLEKKRMADKSPAVSRPSASRALDIDGIEKAKSMQPAVDDAGDNISNILDLNKEQILSFIPKSKLKNRKDIILTFSLNKSGLVDNVRLVPDSLNSQNTSDRITELLNQLKFPKPARSTLVTKKIIIN